MATDFLDKIFLIYNKLDKTLNFNKISNFLFIYCFNID